MGMSFQAIVIAANNTHVLPQQGLKLSLPTKVGKNDYADILRDICYKYRKQRKESFIRDPVLCLVLLCFIIHCCTTDFCLFNRLGKAWTVDSKDVKAKVIIAVFQELIRLIQLIC